MREAYDHLCWAVQAFLVRMVARHSAGLKASPIKGRVNFLRVNVSSHQEEQFRVLYATSTEMTQYHWTESLIDRCQMARANGFLVFVSKANFQIRLCIDLERNGHCYVYLLNTR